MNKYKHCILKLNWIYSLVKTISYKALIDLAIQKKKKKSVLFFTQHKSASTFATKILESIGSANQGLKHVNYQNLTSDLGCYFNFGERFNNENDWYYQNSRNLFNDNGYIYGPHRAPFYIPNLEIFKKIIFLRDPRDSLISRYYSFGYNHGIPQDSMGKKVFLEERNKIKQESIDSYCVRMANEWSKPLLSDYKKIIQSSLEIPLIIKYEKYVDNPKEVIRNIFEYCDITNFSNQIDALAYKANPIQSEIRSSAHQRSGRVFQYIHELQPETITKIFHILKDEIVFFGWE